ncbi:MAG: SDR family oxidoreductase [Labilithrix sp.]|nr:SDR family oxidoreductase [Labilithrix sp.]
MVTGASSGVGLELTKKLLEADVHVCALTRSPLPDDPVVSAALERGQLESVTGDLSLTASREGALASVATRHATLDAIFNVAGVSLGAPEITPQGREIHFEVNTVAPFVVLHRLRPLLARGDEKLVVNVSSNAALSVKDFDPKKLARPTSFKKLLGPYAASKLALSQWSHAIAPELARDGLRVLSVCPGPNKTPMTAGDGMPFWLLPFRPFMFSHPSKGAARLWEAAFESRSLSSGTFVVKGKATSIPFADEAAEVLALVEAAVS